MVSTSSCCPSLSCVLTIHLLSIYRLTCTVHQVSDSVLHTYNPSAHYLQADMLSPSCFCQSLRYVHNHNPSPKYLQSIKMLSGSFKQTCTVPQAASRFLYAYSPLSMKADYILLRLSALTYRLIGQIID